MLYIDNIDYKENYYKCKYLFIQLNISGDIEYNHCDNKDNSENSINNCTCELCPLIKK
jgi:hypothetical protein